MQSMASASYADDQARSSEGKQSRENLAGQEDSLLPSHFRLSETLEEEEEGTDWDGL